MVVGAAAWLLAGCSASAPGLTLTFLALPSDARDLRVELSSPHFAFAGQGAQAGGVQVSYPGDGTIAIALDRAQLWAAGDQIRLGLRAHTPLEVTAVARATSSSGQALESRRTDTALPDADLNLRFSFVVADGGVDVPPDLSGQDLAGVDLTSSSHGDGGADGGAACSIVTAVGASAGPSQTGPSLAYHAPYFGLVWLNSSNQLFYNAVDLSQATPLQNAADVSLYAPGGNGTLHTPKLLAVTGSFPFAVAYGVKPAGGASGQTYLEVRKLTAQTGTPTTAAATGATVTDTVAPDIGGLALSDNGVLAGASRKYDLSGATPAVLNRFSLQPLLLGSTTPTQLGATYATSISWSPVSALFGIAYISAPNPAGGTVLTYDEDMTQLPNPIVFTGGTDQPATVSGAPGVALAAGGSRFAVAWADAQSETTGCPECVSGSEIFLTTIPAGGGTRVGEVHVSETALNATSGKYHPAVAWDGVSFAVVWLEYVQGMSRVWLRRYDPQLQPIGPPTWVSQTAPNHPGPNEVGLAVVGPGEYGVAFQMISGTQQELVRVTCNGP